VINGIKIYERVEGGYHGSVPPPNYVSFRSFDECAEEARKLMKTVYANPIMKPGTKADFFAKTLGPKGSFVATRMRGPTHPLKNNGEKAKLNLNLKHNFMAEKLPTEMGHVTVFSAENSNFSPVPTPIKVPDNLL